VSGRAHVPRCDSCGALGRPLLLPPGAATDAEAARLLRDAMPAGGWRSLGGRDLCGSCWPWHWGPALFLGASPKTRLEGGDGTG